MFTTPTPIAPEPAPLMTAMMRARACWNATSTMVTSLRVIKLLLFAQPTGVNSHSPAAHLVAGDALIATMPRALASAPPIALRAPTVHLALATLGRGLSTVPLAKLGLFAPRVNTRPLLLLPLKTALALR